MTRTPAAAGERVVARERRHWISLVHPLLLASMPLVPAALASWWLRPGFEVTALVSLSALAVSGGLTIAALASWVATDMVLTDRRVIVRRGVFARSTQVVALERVQDVSTFASPIGRLLEFGRIEIDAAGVSGRQVLDGLRAPQTMRNRVFVQLQALRSREHSASAGHRAPETAGAGGFQGRRQDNHWRTRRQARRDGVRRP